jgi:hypothetical protein
VLFYITVKIKSGHMLQIKESNREEFQILSPGMRLVSPSLIKSLSRSNFITLNEKDSNPIAIAECGTAIPEEIDLHFGETLRFWNIKIIRAGDAQYYLNSALIYFAAYALKNRYDSIVIEILPDARPAAIQSGFIVRESAESDKLYATKRLF